MSVLCIAYTLRTLGAALSNSKIRIVFPHQPWRRFMAFKKTTKNQVPEVQLAREQHTALSNNFQTQWDLPKQLILWQSNTAKNNSCRSILFWERRVAFCNAMLDFRRTMNLWEQISRPKYFTVHLRNDNDPTSHIHAVENSRVNPPKLQEFGHHGSSEGPTQDPMCPKDAAKR